MGAKPPIFVCKPSCVTGRRWWNFSISGRRCSFSRAAPCRTFTRRRVRRTVGGRSPRNPTMAACSATGSIACVRRWRPLAWAGWASPAARIWRIFQCHPLAALRAVCCPPPAAPRLAAATRRTGQHLVNGNALVARLLRSALDAGVRFQLNAPVVRLLQGPPGVSGAVLRSDGGEIHVEAGAVVLACGGFPDRQRLAQVVPHAAEGYGHFSAAPPDNQGEGSGLANPSAASSTLPCATRWPRAPVSASLWPAASS